MLLATLLTGCAPVWGTWMFTKEVTLPTGDECTDSVSHDFVGAYEPIEAGDDPSWTEVDTGSESAEVFFARVERTSDGAVMIVGTDALPGTELKDGSWLFYWTNTTTGSDSLTHVTGYSFTHTYESSSTLRIAGDLVGDSFEGTWESETTSNDAWTESDTWSDEAAATVTTVGAIPSSTYLLKIDDAGAEVAVTNTQAGYDCGEAGCALTVQEACAYRYTLTGQSTNFDPSDSRWVEDAGQAAGN